MLGKKFYEKRFSPYPFPKSFLIFIRLYGVLYYHPKLATVSLDAFSPEGHIARDVRAYRTFVYRVCPRQTYRAELCEAFLPPSSRRRRSMLSRPKGISREPCEHIALLYIACASGKHITPSYARHFFPQACERAFGSQ